MADSNDYGSRGAGMQRPGGRDEQSYGGDRDRAGGRDDRNFLDRAGEQVKSWFSDDDDTRRRERYAADDRRASASVQSRNPSNQSQDHDPHYSSWRQQQIDALDRDYHEYRQHSQSKFENDFGSWRTQRQSQRALVDKIDEHMEVTGSDGQHVGTVDKIRGDRVILTKSDPNAGGHHHSFPSMWIQNVDDKVVLNKTADEAKRAWRDEDRSSAMFGEGERASQSRDQSSDGPHILNRSFSGTY